MAKKPTTASVTFAASAIALLSAVVASAGNEPGYMFVAATDDARALAEAGLIEVNPEVTNEAGEAAARATEAGTKFMETQTADTGTEAPKTAAPKIEFKRGRKAPAPERVRTGKPDLYPFADLEAPNEDGNDYFFVAATAERPDPWTSLASTVSTASKRYARKTGEEQYVSAKTGETKTRNTYENDRKFKLTRGKEDGVDGAYIERTK